MGRRDTGLGASLPSNKGWLASPLLHAILRALHLLWPVQLSFGAPACLDGGDEQAGRRKARWIDERVLSIYKLKLINLGLDGDDKSPILEFSTSLIRGPTRR